MESTQTVAATRARRRRVIVEYRNDGGPEWWLMWYDGRIEVFDTAQAAFNAISRGARRGNRTVTITTIEWRNAPEGFTPPAGEVR